MYTYCYIHSYITGIQSNYAAYNLFFCLVTFSHSHNATLKKKKKTGTRKEQSNVEYTEHIQTYMCNLILLIWH